MHPRYVYKLCTEAEWKSGEILRGSAHDRRDGYIHFSTAEQVPGTFAKYFASQRDLVLLRAVTHHVSDRLRWEPSRDGALFPHLYGVLEDGELLCVAHLPQGPDGGSILPEQWLREDGRIES
jgi:uncharacterized protein (DUF952 family)